MLQVCVVPNNLCFGSHLSGELRFLLVQAVGQVTCLSNNRYIFSIDGLRELKGIVKCTFLYFGSMSHSRIVLDADSNEPPLFPSEDGSLSEKNDPMGTITHNARQVQIIAVLFSPQVTLERRQ